MDWLNNGYIQRKTYNTALKNKDPLAFKHRLIVDVGASDPRGSIKILAQTDDGKDIFTRTGYVNDKTNGFTSEKSFIEKITQIVLDSSKEAAEKAKQMGIGKEEEKLTGLTLFLPGPIIEDEAIIMANLRKKDGNSLTNVDLSQIEANLKNNTAGVKIDNDFKFIPTKDLGGTGIGIAKLLANHPVYADKLKEGSYIVGVMTGGGFGSVNMKVLDNRYMLIETSESSHNLAIDQDEKKITRLGKLGATAKGMIENYSSGLGLSTEEANELLKTGKAQLATEKSIELDNTKDKKAIDILINSGYYRTKNQNDETTVLEIDSSDAGNVRKFKEARKQAIDEYADAVAQHAISKINEGANILVLTGPLALGLNKTIRENPKEFGQNSLKGLIIQKIDNYIGSDLTCQKLRDAHKFDIVCSDDIKLANNTTGGNILLDDKTRIIQRRGEWIILPISELKEEAA